MDFSFCDVCSWGRVLCCPRLTSDSPSSCQPPHLAQSEYFQKKKCKGEEQPVFLSPLALKIEIILNMTDMWIHCLLLPGLISHVSSWGLGHQWMIFTKWKIMFCQKGKTSVTALKTGFLFAVKSSLWSYCRSAGAFVNMDCFQLQELPVGRKRCSVIVCTCRSMPVW